MTSHEEKILEDKLRSIPMEELNKITIKKYIPSTPIYKIIDGDMVQCGWQINSIPNRYSINTQ
jgi:hypothetical protein